MLGKVTATQLQKLLQPFKENEKLLQRYGPFLQVLGSVIVTMTER